MIKDKALLMELEQFKDMFVLLEEKDNSDCNCETPCKNCKCKQTK